MIFFPLFGKNWGKKKNKNGRTSYAAAKNNNNLSLGLISK